MRNSRAVRLLRDHWIMRIVYGRVRAARAKARLAQLQQLPRRKGESDAERAAALLKLERISDAVAEAEFTDMGFSKAAARRTVVEALKHTHVT